MCGGAYYIFEQDTECLSLSLSFFFNDTATPELYPLSLHDALPIYFPISLGDQRAILPCNVYITVGSFGTMEKIAFGQQPVSTMVVFTIIAKDEEKEEGGSEDGGLGGQLSKKRPPHQSLVLSRLRYGPDLLVS